MVFNGIVGKIACINPSTEGEKEEIPSDNYIMQSSLMQLKMKKRCISYFNVNTKNAPFLV